MGYYDCTVIGAGIAGSICAEVRARAGASVVRIGNNEHNASINPTGLLIPPTGRMANKPFGQLLHACFRQYQAWSNALSERSATSVDFTPDVAIRIARDGTQTNHPAAVIQTYELLNALEQSFRAHHGTVISAHAQNITRNPDNSTTIIAGDHHITTKEIILAAGSATPRLAASLQITLDDLIYDAGQSIYINNCLLPHITLYKEFALVPKKTGAWITGIHRIGEPVADNREQDLCTLIQAASEIIGYRPQKIISWSGVRLRTKTNFPRIMSFSHGLIVTGLGSNGYLLAPHIEQVIQTV